MRERILKFLNSENISSTKFADEIGVQRSSVSHILSGRNNPSFEFIYKILDRYKYLNAEWLIMGTGNMVKSVKQASLFENEPVIVSRSENKIDSQSDTVQINKETKTSIPDELIKSLKEKKTERIIIFYSDKTFTEYLPEN